jgi:hypothetical protein
MIASFDKLRKTKTEMDNKILMGTVGGTFLSVVPNLSSDDIVKTVVLASVGAIVSFTISLLLKSLNKKHKK